MDRKPGNHRNSENSYQNRGRTFRGSPRNITNASSENSFTNQKATNVCSVNDSSATSRNFNKGNERYKTNHTNDMEGETEDTSWAARRTGQSREFRQDYRHFESSEQTVSSQPRTSGATHNRFRTPRGGIGRVTSRGRSRGGSDFDNRRGRDSNFNKTDAQSTTARKPATAAPCFTGVERDSVWNDQAKGEKDIALAKSLEKDDLKGIIPESKEQEDEMLRMAMQLSLQDNPLHISNRHIAESFDARKSASTVGSDPSFNVYFDEDRKVNLLQPTEFPPLPSSNIDTPSQSSNQESASVLVALSSIPPQIPVKHTDSVSNSPTSSMVDAKSSDKWHKLGARPKTQPSIISRGAGRGSGGGRGRPYLPGTESDAEAKIGDWVAMSVKSKQSDTPLTTLSNESFPGNPCHDSEKLSPDVTNGTINASVPRLSESKDSVPLPNSTSAHNQETSSPPLVVAMSKNKCDSPFESGAHVDNTQSIASDERLSVKCTVDLSAAGVAVQNNGSELNIKDGHLFTPTSDAGLVTSKVEPIVVPSGDTNIFPVLQEVPSCGGAHSETDKFSNACINTTNENNFLDEPIPEGVAVVESQLSAVSPEMQCTEPAPPKDDKDAIIAHLWKTIEMLQQQGPSGNSVAPALQAPYPTYPIPVPFYTFPVALPFPMLPPGSPHIASGSMHDSTFQQLPTVPISVTEMSGSNPDLSDAEGMYQHTGSCLSPMAAEFVPQDQAVLNVDFRRGDCANGCESQGGRSKGFRISSRPSRKFHPRNPQQVPFPHYNVGVSPWLLPSSGLDQHFSNLAQGGYAPNYMPPATRYRPNVGNASSSNYYSRGPHRSGPHPGNNHCGYP